MTGYKKLTLSLIAGWLTFALVAGAMGVFSNNANRLGVSIAIAALTPLVIFAIWFAASESFRRYLLSVNPRVLTSLQAFRVVGFIFVLLEAHRFLPALFALPAGYGDMAIGVTAAFIAWKVADPAHRGQFILWQILGITDLVTAVTLGITTPVIDPQGVPMTLMTVLPLSLIPTFLVPLFTIFHVISIAQARGWKAPAARARTMAMQAEGSAS
jgi:hypothetical protein